MVRATKNAQLARRLSALLSKDRDGEFARHLGWEFASIERRIAERESLEKDSYEARLRRFIDDLYDSEKNIIGFSSWYPRSAYVTGQEIGGLHQYFREGEDCPCFLRGSIRAIMIRHQIQWHWPHEVLERFIASFVRRKKLTFVRHDDWMRFLREDLKIYELCQRILKKWHSNTNQSITDGFWRWVSEGRDGFYSVIVEGRKIDLRPEIGTGQENWEAEQAEEKAIAESRLDTLQKFAEFLSEIDRFKKAA